MQPQALRQRIRYLLAFFTFALAVSGLTAIPLLWEVSLLQVLLGEGTLIGHLRPALGHWISLVHQALTATQLNYRFLFYGTDWLAFGHIVIAIAFWGPLKDPVRNLWVVEFGMIACVLVIPVAMIFGPIRGIPFFWRLADCSFGVLGIIPLWLARRWILQLALLERLLKDSPLPIAPGQ